MLIEHIQFVLKCGLYTNYGLLMFYKKIRKLEKLGKEKKENPYTTQQTPG